MGKLSSNYPNSNAVEAALDRANSAAHGVSILSEDVVDIKARLDILEYKDITLEKMKVYVTPQMYGAVGDGIADDTAAFKSAFEHSFIFIPKGEYYLTERIDISSDTTIVFDPQAVIKSAYDDTHSTDYTYGSFCAIGTTEIPKTNIKIFGNGAVIDRLESESYCNHFLFKHCKNITISGFECTRGGGKGVMLFHTNNFVVDNIIVSSATTTDAGHGYGVGVDYECYNGRISRIEGAYLRHLVDIAHTSHDIVITNCYGDHSPISGHGLESYDIIVDSCTLIGSAFSMGNSTFTIDYKWTFKSCVVRDKVQGPCFNISNGSHTVLIEDCKCYNSHQGVYIGDSTGVVSYNVTVQNCYFDGMGATCIMVNDNVDKIRISESHIVNSGSDLTTTLISIGECEDIAINGLIIDSCTVSEAAIYVRKSATVSITNSLIKNNIGRGILVEGRNGFIKISDSSVNVSGALNNAIYIYACTNAIITNCSGESENYFIIGRNKCILTNCICNGKVLLEETEDGFTVANNEFYDVVKVLGDYNIVTGNKSHDTYQYEGEHSEINSNISLNEEPEETEET